MGTKLDKEDKINSIIKDKYTRKKNLNDPSNRYFEESVIYQLKEDEQKLVVIKKFILYEKVQYTQWLDKIEKRNLINCENILPIKEVYHEINKDSYCLTGFNLDIIFDYLPETLSQEIETRAKTKQYFSEEEFSQLLKGTINALYIFQLNSVTNQCIRPQVISIQKKEGQIIPIVCDATLVKTQKNFLAVQSDPGNKKKHFYLSPVLVKVYQYQDLLIQKAIHEQNNSPPYDLYRSDVFCLGITLLHAGTLTPLDDIYDFEDGSLDEDQLKEKISQLKEQYSEEICTIIDHMLIMDDEARMDFKALKLGIDNGFVEEDQKKEESKDQIILNQSFYDRQNDKMPTRIIQSKNEDDIHRNKHTQKSMVEKEQITAGQVFNSIKLAIDKSFHFDDQDINNQQEDYVQVQEGLTKKYSGNNFLGILSESSQKQPISRSQTHKEKQSFQTENSRIKEDQSQKAKPIKKERDLIIPQIVIDTQQISEQQPIQVKSVENIEEQNEISQSQNHKTLEFEIDNKLSSINEKSSHHQFDFDSQIEKSFHSHREIVVEYPQIIVTTPKAMNQSQLTQSVDQQFSARKIQSQSESQKQFQEKEKDYTNQSSSRQQFIDLVGKTRSQSQYQTQTDRREKNTINEQSYDSKYIYNERQRPSSHHIVKNTPVFDNSSPISKISIVNESFNDGSKYFGEKLMNMKHGWGKQTFPNGGVYEGQWKNDQMDGIGTLYYPSGKIAYEGHWSENQFNGQGTLYNEFPQLDYLDYKDLNRINNNWLKYVGGFLKDVREGFGTIYFANNEKFQCNFNEDVARGSGIYFQKDGSLIKGFWRNNFLQEQL